MRGAQKTWLMGEEDRPTPTARVPKAVADVVIGERCRFEGKLFLDGRCRIDGLVRGEVSARGELEVGETGEVTAGISGEIVRVFGTVIGGIVCTSKIELKQGASVRGDISAPAVVIEDGVSFEGYCNMQVAQVAAEEPEGVEVKVVELSSDAVHETE